MRSISKLLLAYILIYKLENISTFPESEDVEPSSPFYTKKPITLNLYDNRTTSQIQYTYDEDTNTRTFVPKEGYELWEVVLDGPELKELGEKKTWRSESSSTTALKVVKSPTEDKDIQVKIYLKNGDTISFFTYTFYEKQGGWRQLLKTTTIHQRSRTSNGYKVVTVNRNMVKPCDIHGKFIAVVILTYLLSLFLIGCGPTICSKLSHQRQRCTSTSKNEGN